MGWLSGRRYALLVMSLTMAVLGLGVFVVAVFAVPGFADRYVWHLAAPSASVAPGESNLAPMRVPIPATADCVGCHQNGSMIASIPRMAHPIEGWKDCTACHADDKLVKTAPGHSGIHKELCLDCHQPVDPSASALPRPHHIVSDRPCIACHGAGAAPLPTDMAGRSNCWVCHPGADTVALFNQTFPGGPGTNVTPAPSLPLPSLPGQTVPP